MTRQYKSGSQWAVWRWTEVLCNGRPYLDRLHIFKTPWFSIMLHYIRAPDAQEDMHNHPVNFISILLRGDYKEIRNGTLRYAARVNYFGRDDWHRITGVKAGGALTLAIAGPVYRTWGYMTKLRGFVPWRDYQN